MENILATTYKEIASYLTSKKGQCVLVLGPEIAVDQQGVSYKVHFRKLASDKNNGIFTYFEKENLFSFSDQLGLKTTRREVKEFYKNCGDPVLLEMIARIRFQLIINVSPDTAINRLYEKNNIPFKEGYFSKDSRPQTSLLPFPTKDMPVIYNIFGCAEPDTSLILEHSKLYETIQYLLPENSLPENIEEFLSQASSFILLGFKFDSWHYQLICHKLKLKGEYSKINLSASAGDDTSDVSLIMRKHFEIELTPENPAQAIERIIAECKEDPEAIRPKGDQNTYSLFVSYAWKDQGTNEAANRESVVDWLQKYSPLKDEPKLRFFRDHTDLHFGESIDSFMTRIGKGKTVIQVISDKYLKSRYCMTEALRINRYQDHEQRIFVIIWEDAQLDNEIHYRDFWKEKCENILEDIDKKLDNDDYDHAVQIYRYMPQFINMLKDRVNPRLGKNDLVVNAETGEVTITEQKKAALEAFANAILQKSKEN